MGGHVRSMGSIQPPRILSQRPDGTTVRPGANAECTRSSRTAPFSRSRSHPTRRLPHIPTAIDRRPDGKNYLRGWHNASKKSINFSLFCHAYPLRRAAARKQKKGGANFPTLFQARCLLASHDQPRVRSLGGYDEELFSIPLMLIPAMRHRLGHLLCYSPPPHAHTLLVIGPAENVVAEIPDMMMAAEITSATRIFRIVLLPFCYKNGAFY
jgi:hypothetical protein